MTGRCEALADEHWARAAPRMCITVFYARLACGLLAGGQTGATADEHAFAKAVSSGAFRALDHGGSSRRCCSRGDPTILQRVSTWRRARTLC